MGKILKIFGILFLIVGITVFFNSFQGMTGFAVYENVDTGKGFVVGIWFILTGIILAVYRKKDKLIRK